MKWLIIRSRSKPSTDIFGNPETGELYTDVTIREDVEPLKRDEELIATLGAKSQLIPFKQKGIKLTPEEIRHRRDGSSNFSKAEKININRFYYEIEGRSLDGYKTKFQFSELMDGFFRRVADDAGKKNDEKLR